MSEKLEQLAKNAQAANEALREEVGRIIDTNAQEAAAERIDAAIKEVAQFIDPKVRDRLVIAAKGAYMEGFLSGEMAILYGEV